MKLRKEWFVRQKVDSSSYLRAMFFTLRSILLIMLLLFILKFFNIDADLTYSVALLALLRSYELEFYR